MMDTYFKTDGQKFLGRGPVPHLLAVLPSRFVQRKDEHPSNLENNSLYANIGDIRS